MTETFAFGNLALAAMSVDEAADWIRLRVRNETTCIVVTSNIHHLRLAEIDEDFREVIEKAELNVPDGWPLVLAGRLLPGASPPERVAGVDLVDRVLHSDGPFRVAILGGAAGAARRLAHDLQGSQDVVLVDPLPRGTWENDKSIEDLCKSLESRQPNLVLIALGAPRQELLARTVRPFVSGPIVCCGASVEILAGVRPRAPGFLQRAGLEWAFRAGMEPGRLFPRYARGGAWFLYLLGRELGGIYLGRHGSTKPSS